MNPVRDATAKIATGKRAPTSPHRRGDLRLVELFRESDRAARRLDLPDLVDWMLATGCRIGEALALRYGSNGDGKPMLDLHARTWEVNGTVVRVSGTGLRVQPRPKTKAGWRVVAIPDFAVQMLERRAVGSRRLTDSVVFASPLARARCAIPRTSPGAFANSSTPSSARPAPAPAINWRGDGSFVLGAAGRRVRCAEGPWSWVTSHTFRKTVATRLDEAGLTPRQVADQLGHANPSMTLDVYFGRQVVSADAARVLDR